MAFQFQTITTPLCGFVAGESGLCLRADHSEAFWGLTEGLRWVCGASMGAGLKTDLNIFFIVYCLPTARNCKQCSAHCWLPSGGCKVCMDPPRYQPPHVENLTAASGIQTSVTAVSCWAVKEKVKSSTHGFWQNTKRFTWSKVNKLENKFFLFKFFPFFKLEERREACGQLQGGGWSTQLDIFCGDGRDFDKLC